MINLTNEEAQQLLDELWNSFNEEATKQNLLIAIEALRAALAQPEQEPVAWRGSNWSLSNDEYVYRDYDDPLLNTKGENVGEPLYTAPPQRESVYCGCGDEIVSGDGARCGTCVAVKYKEKEWVGFTQEEHQAAMRTDGSFGAGFLYAEKLLKEKNNG